MQNFYWLDFFDKDGTRGLFRQAVAVAPSQPPLDASGRWREFCFNAEKWRECLHYEALKPFKVGDGAKGWTLLLLLQKIHTINGRSGPYADFTEENHLSPVKSLIDAIRKNVDWLSRILETMYGAPRISDVLSLNMPKEKSKDLGGGAEKKTTPAVILKNGWLDQTSIIVTIRKDGKLEEVKEPKRLYDIVNAIQGREDNPWGGSNLFAVTADQFFRPFMHDPKDPTQGSAILFAAYNDPAHHPDITSVITVARLLNSREYPFTNFFFVHRNQKDFEALDMNKKKAVVRIGRHQEVFQRVPRMDRTFKSVFEVPPLGDGSGKKLTPERINRFYWIKAPSGEEFKTQESPEERTDYGLIRLFKDTHYKLWIAEFAGLSRLGTEGATGFVADNFKGIRINRRFGPDLDSAEPQPFEVLVKVHSPVRFLDPKRRIYNTWKSDSTEALLVYLGKECVYRSPLIA